MSKREIAFWVIILVLSLAFAIYTYCWAGYDWWIPLLVVAIFLGIFILAKVLCAMRYL